MRRATCETMVLLYNGIVPRVSERLTSSADLKVAEVCITTEAYSVVPDH